MCDQYSGQEQHTQMLHTYCDEIMKNDYIGSLGCIPNELKNMGNKLNYVSVPMWHISSLNLVCLNGHSFLFELSIYVATDIVSITRRQTDVI